MYGAMPGLSTPDDSKRQVLRLLSIVQFELKNDTTNLDRAYDAADKAFSAVETLRILDAAATRKREVPQ